MIIQGVIEKRLPLISGKSAKDKPWYKQSWIINTTQFGNICVDFVRNNEDDIPNLIAGENVEFVLQIDCREYKEKWYTNCKTNDFILLRNKVDYSQPVSEEEQEGLITKDMPF